MHVLKHLLLPDPPRSLPHARVWNIAFRTMHIGVTGILFGGHVFAVSEDVLRPWLYLTILTGAFLLTIEAYPSCRWFYQGRGILLLTKLLLLCGTLLLWPYRVWLLAGVVVLASVGSHMPARFRYYSVVHRRVLND